MRILRVEVTLGTRSRDADRVSFGPLIPYFCCKSLRCINQHAEVALANSTHVAVRLLNIEHSNRHAVKCTASSSSSCCFTSCPILKCRIYFMPNLRHLPKYHIRRFRKLFSISMTSTLYWYLSSHLTQNHVCCLLSHFVLRLPEPQDQALMPNMDLTERHLIFVPSGHAHGNPP